MSYSRTDEQVMRRIVNFLRSRGIHVWVDNEKLVPGTPIWEAEIEKAIFGASATVVLLSPDSKTSEWVRREISYTERYQKRIFPVLVRGDENSSVSIRLTNHQYVDVRDDEEMGLERLSTALLFYLEDLETQQRKALEAAEKLPQSKAGRERAEGAQLERDELERKRVEQEQLGRSQVEVKNIAEKERAISSRRLVIVWIWITLGWAIGTYLGLIRLAVSSGLTTGVIIGGIGGFITGIALRRERLLSDWRTIAGVTLSWVGGWVIGWYFVGALAGVAIGGAIGGFGTAFFLRIEKVFPSWKNILIVTLGWSIGWVLVESLFMVTGGAISIPLVGALIGGIGGFVTIWQIRAVRS